MLLLVRLLNRSQLEALPPLLILAVCCYPHPTLQKECRGMVQHDWATQHRELICYLKKQLLKD